MNVTNSSAPYFEEFSRASELNEFTAVSFADRVASYVPDQRLRTLSTTSDDQPLLRTVDPLDAVSTRRVSVRMFSSAEITELQLGSLLQGFAADSAGRRMFPSAGGLYPIEVVVALARVQRTPRQIAVYHPDTHALGCIADLPPWPEWQNVLGSGIETEPAVTIFLCAHIDVMCEKYNERGGRFVLLEIGHAGQMLALRAVASGLGAYALGGTLESAANRLFGFAHLADAPIPVLAYACGLPEASAASVSRRRRWSRNR